jgi:hypothetical protein
MGSTCLLPHLVGLPTHFFYGLFPLEFHFLDLAIHVPSLSLHPIGLGVNFISRLPKQDSLPNHASNLQETDYNQPACEPDEMTLYLEILASLLAGLIASWGDWLWAGGYRWRGGLVCGLALWLFLSFFTGFLFGDPLFWRVGSRILSGRNPNQYEETDYRQRFVHDGENVSRLARAG